MNTTAFSFDILDRMVLAVERVRERVVRLGLSAYRLKDRIDLRDLIDVGLIDATWPARLPPELGARLQHLLDTPDG
jgi:hypothetical protein